MQIVSLPDQKIKIIYKNMNEYMALLQLIHDQYRGNGLFTDQYAERLENSIQRAFDADDESAGGKPSSIIENRQIDDVFTLFCFASSKLNKVEPQNGNLQCSPDDSKIKELEKNNELLKLIISRMAAES